MSEDRRGTGANDEAAVSSGFTVDTHLFRELGDLLVGRESTAVIELIKNAYDADATEVIVYGERLEDPKKGFIRISDNGTGMDPDAFRNGFLRIASRTKDAGTRRSGVFGRRYTGAKGIGRLAAHKLSRALRIESTTARPSSRGRSTAWTVRASIDWDAIERLETLDQVTGSGAVSVETARAPKGVKSGTTLDLSRLRRSWTKQARARFHAEVQSFTPPSILSEPLNPETVPEAPLLFDRPATISPGGDSDRFRILLEGDLEAGEGYWALFEQAATWVIEISSSREDGKIRVSVSPTSRTRRNPKRAKAGTEKTSVDHPRPDSGPFFQGRIFVREGSLSGSGRDQKTWVTASSGVRVYMEGFRVLPYGEDSNDWLGLNRRYTTRSRSLDMGSASIFDGSEETEGSGHRVLPNNSYFGAVFLLQDDASDLKMLINREGFVPDEGYDLLVATVRSAIDLSVRVRAASYGKDTKEPVEPERVPASPLSPIARLEKLERNAVRSARLLEEVRESLASDEFEKRRTRPLAKKLELAGRTFAEAEGLHEEIASEQSLLRVLATIGTQMSGFVHELRGVLGTSSTLEESVDRVRSTPGLAADSRRSLSAVTQGLQDLRRSMERHAVYLTDVLDPDVRRRRTRQVIADRLDLAVKVVERAAERKRSTIENKIPRTLRTAPMFAPELVAVFTNVLSNAVKAVEKGGRIQATANAETKNLVVMIQNTGRRVELDHAERWFRPFESTSYPVDPDLGQGMGLGLPITRRLLEGYDGDVRFVRPGKGFATAVRIELPR